MESKEKFSQTIDSESMRDYNDYVHVGSSVHFYGYMSLRPVIIKVERIEE